MDAHQFDALTRTLGDRLSRRGLGRLVGGLALGGGIATRWPAPADAKKKRKKKRKKKDRNDCDGGCGIGTCCDGRCANTPTDRNNCGACGNRCQPGQYCFNSQCVPCESPMESCPADGIDRCVNTMTDRDNCGQCGNICPRDSNPQRNYVCQGGQCVCTGTVCANGRCCPDGFNVCVAGGAGCCPNNYHSCGNGECCPDGYTCGGNCGFPCCQV